MTLTSDLVFKNYYVQSISSILFDVGIPNLGWWFLLGWRSGAYHFESLWPWHWLLASFLGFWCYITAIFPQMCLMLDQFLWGHSSCVCDISCFPILLKLYRCFCQGLKMCMTFGYNPQINFCHFFHSLNLVNFGLNYYWSLWPLGTLWAQLLLQFYPNSFETLLLFLSRTEDVHDIWI